MNIFRSSLILAWVAGLTLLATVAVGVGWWATDAEQTPPPTAKPADTSIPLGVLGDSDSHSYQDRVTFAPGNVQRGGVYRARTFQWTEVLAMLRGDHLDAGPWGVWGSGPRWARWQEWLGRPGRAPKKEDYLHNFALAGAECLQLTWGPYRQAPRLRALMDRSPERWRRGVVVIRIGVNSFGMSDSLDQLAHDPAAPEVRTAMTQCLIHIKVAMALIHQGHPQTRFVLVGIFNNTHWPPYRSRWRSHATVAGIKSGLNTFDEALRQLAADDDRVAFFDDRAWFAQRWGGRDERGQPHYKDVLLRPDLAIAHAQGDWVGNAVLADGHAGVVWNALWAQSLVALMNTTFAMQIPPITDEEVARFAQPGGAAQR